LWIVGDSTLHAWHSVATKVETDIEFTAPSPSEKISALDALKAGGLKKVALRIPVAEMKSGKAKLDTNMQKALKAEQNPVIHFRMDSYSTAPADAAGTEINIVAKGVLEIAGTQKPIDLEALASMTAEGIRIKGVKQLLMTDFGVKPPVILLIKTHNPVMVHYDLLLPSEK
jgi:hypothetical protein